LCWHAKDTHAPVMVVLFWAGLQCVKIFFVFLKRDEIIVAFSSLFEHDLLKTGYPLLDHALAALVQ